MDPSAIWRPVGGRPPSVYWVRRAVLLLVVVVLLVLLAHACGGGGGGTPAANHSPAPVPSTTHTPTPRPTSHPHPSTPGPSTSTTVAACTSSDLRVTVTTDASVYPAGVLPHLRATARNVGAADCRYDASAVARPFDVVSGSDRVWSSTACVRGGPEPVTLRRGASIAYTVTWDRHRSPASCASTGAAALSGTYRVTAEIGGVRSAEAVFSLES